MGSRLLIRGSTVDAARRFAHRHKGTDAYGAFVDSLESTERALLDGHVDRSSWYDVQAYGNMLDKGARALAPHAQERFLSDGGRFVVDDGVTTIYRVFFAIASPAFVLRGSAMMWRTFFKGSKLRIDRSGRKFVQARIVDADYCLLPLCYSIRGGMICSLEHGGARDVEIERHRCKAESGTACEFSFRWR